MSESLDKPEGCRKKLAPGQWWAFCGETDMGQSLPALCTQCGGEYKLAVSEIAKDVADKELQARIDHSLNRKFKVVEEKSAPAAVVMNVLQALELLIAECKDNEGAAEINLDPYIEAVNKAKKYRYQCFFGSYYEGKGGMDDHFDSADSIDAAVDLIIHMARQYVGRAYETIDEVWDSYWGNVYDEYDCQVVWESPSGSDLRSR